MSIVQRKDLYTPLKKQVEYFSDFLDNLDVHPVKKDIGRLINEEAIKRSIKNIILTNTGDRVFNPTFGSDINRMLFEPFSIATQTVIRDLVRNSIENYEPRALLEDVRVEGEIDSNSLLVTVVFSILNSEAPVTLEIILNRIR